MHQPRPDRRRGVFFFCHRRAVEEHGAGKDVCVARNTRANPSALKTDVPPLLEVDRDARGTKLNAIAALMVVVGDRNLTCTPCGMHREVVTGT